MKWVKLGLLVLMAAFYFMGGVNHFRDAQFYLDMMPPYIPAHGAMVAVSGVAEILLAILVLVPATRTLAAWGIILMLIAFLPVHVHMLVNNHLFPGVPTAFLWGRFPAQALLIVWAWWYTLPAKTAPAP